MDAIDQAILTELQQDSSISNVELARRVDLSPPAVHARIKRLEEAGLITAYVALLDREKLGFDLLCFVQVSLQTHDPEQIEAFQQKVMAMPEVLEGHYLTGSVDYLLKVVIKNKSDLSRFLMENLSQIPGIARIQTSIALKEIKSKTALPLSAD